MAEQADLEAQPRGGEKWALFGAFLNVVLAGFTAALFLRASFFEFSGSNAANTGDAAFWGTAEFIGIFAGMFVASMVLMFFVFGRARTATG